MFFYFFANLQVLVISVVLSLVLRVVLCSLLFSQRPWFQFCWYILSILYVVYEANPTLWVYADFLGWCCFAPWFRVHIPDVCWLCSQVWWWLPMTRLRRWMDQIPGYFLFTKETKCLQRDNLGDRFRMYHSGKLCSGPKHSKRRLDV